MRRATSCSPAIRPSSAASPPRAFPRRWTMASTWSTPSWMSRARRSRSRVAASISRARARVRSEARATSTTYPMAMEATQTSSTLWTVSRVGAPRWIRLATATSVEAKAAQRQPPLMANASTAPHGPYRGERRASGLHPRGRVGEPGEQDADDRDGDVGREEPFGATGRARHLRQGHQRPAYQHREVGDGQPWALELVVRADEEADRVDHRQDPVAGERSPQRLLDRHAHDPLTLRHIPHPTHDDRVRDRDRTRERGRYEAGRSLSDRVFSACSLCSSAFCSLAVCSLAVCSSTFYSLAFCSFSALARAALAALSTSLSALAASAICRLAAVA